MPSAWSDRELATLAALAETFVRGDAVRRGRLAAEALEAAVDPAQLDQIRLALRLFESRAANLGLARRAQPFSAMSMTARERYLLGWGSSALPMRRAAFSSLRKLLTFLAYADPGVDAPNPRQTTIGYQPEWPPTTPDRTPIRPFIPPSATGPGEPVVLDADVVVVGSGAAGGVVAAALAEAGRSVVVLEAGPFVDEASMPTSELDAFDRLYLDHGLTSTWDGSITILAGAAVGGGTLVNWTTSIAAPAGIRQRWGREHGIEGLGDGADDAWSQDLAAIEHELDVAESGFLPPKDALILRGAAALGWEAAPTRRDAVGCDDCGSCAFGCRRGSKRSGIRVHLARAHAAGARIVPDTEARRLILDEGRAVGVEAVYRPEDGGARAVTVRARQVILAAGALRSPSVLQRSGLTHPAIGRHLRLHPVTVVAGRMPFPVEMWRGPLQAARSLQFLEDEPGRNGYAIEAAPGHAGLLALALPWEGTQAHAGDMREARHLTPLIAVTRDGGEGRATLTRAGNVRLDYRLDATGVATLRHAAVRLAMLARAGGASDILVAATPALWFRGGSGSAGRDDAAFSRYLDRVASLDLAPNRATIFSAHQMGSVRMGADPRDHPSDPWGRIRVDHRADRAVGGLYVADSSLFPTGLGVNPMLTVMALARRVARTVLAEG